MTGSTDRGMPAGRLRALALRFLRQKEIGILAILALLVALVCFYQPENAPPNYLKTAFLTVSRQIAFTAIVALGVFCVILTAGIDLSLGSIVGLSGFVCGMALVSGVHPFLAVLAGMLTGAAVGAVNGAIVAYIGVTPFIVTLGMLGIARGIVWIISRGNSVEGIPEAFIAAGTRNYGGILPVPLLALALLAVAMCVILKYTVFGRRIYAVGGNEEATALSGIDTRTVKFFTYVLCGVCCSITGMLTVARVRSAQADAGKGMELDAIAAAVIGGTSLMGGEGSVLGVLIGASIMGVIRFGLVGAGRTELARLIVGAERRSHGSIFVRGIKAAIRHPSDAVRHGIGYASEDRKRYGLVLPMTVRENITMSIHRRILNRLGLISGLKERTIADRLISALHVKTSSREQTVRTLSGGNQQKIVIAKWLATDPAVLILDEPTRGIDVAAKAEVHKIITDLADRGVAVIVISSELPEILHLTDRILVMHEGRLTADIPRAQADEETIMKAAIA